MDKSKFKYYCETCGKLYDISPEIMLCPECKENNIEGKPLKGILKVKLPDELFNCKNIGDDFNVFDFLPVEEDHFSNIPVGNTPLIHAEYLIEDLGLNNIYLKFDGLNPSGSFKDRASYLVSAFAKKHGIKEIAVASTGNAASSMACIGAAANQKVFVFMSKSAPRAKQIQCLQYGAELITVKGNYDTAFDLSLQFSYKEKILNRNTAYNPLTIEGKKTVSFELIKQLKNKEISYVYLPVGDGVILSGVIKGFNDLKNIGLIKKIPQIIGVQAIGSAFIYNLFKNGKLDFKYKSNTIADSISVDIARNAYTAVQDLKKIGGDIITVSDEEILNAQKYLASKTGIFCEPSSATAAAGLIAQKKEVSKNSIKILLLTGNGLKDIDAAAKRVKFPDVFEPDINVISKELGRT